MARSLGVKLAPTMVADITGLGAFAIVFNVLSFINSLWTLLLSKFICLNLFGQFMLLDNFNLILSYRK
jgi:hypothetical protein